MQKAQHQIQNNQVHSSIVKPGPANLPLGDKIAMTEYFVINYPHLKNKIWFNTSPVKGFRLTYDSYRVLKDIIPQYIMPLPTEKKTKVDFLSLELIKMDLHVKKPFYVNTKDFVTFDEEFASAIGLCGNNIVRAIDMFYG